MYDDVKWGCPVKRVINTVTNTRGNGVSTSGTEGFQYNAMRIEKHDNMEAGKKKVCTGVKKMPKVGVRQRQYKLLRQGRGLGKAWGLYLLW